MLERLLSMGAILVAHSKLLITLENSMRFLNYFHAALLVAAIFAVPAYGQIGNISIDFESPGFDLSDLNAVDGQGFDFFFNSTGGTPAFGDFNGFNALPPSLDVNSPNVFSAATGADALAGGQSLVFFTDFNSSLVNTGLPANAGDPRVLNLSVFTQNTITSADVGLVATYDFLFAAANGSNITDPSTAVEAFILTNDPNNGFATTNNIGFDLSNATLGNTEAGQVSLLIDSSLVGQTLQFGFRNAAADGQNPAVILDNLSLTFAEPAAGVPEPSSLATLSMVGMLAFMRRRRS